MRASKLCTSKILQFFINGLTQVDLYNGHKTVLVYHWRQLVSIKEHGVIWPKETKQ